MTRSLKIAALSVSAFALTAGSLAAATLDEIREAGTIRIAVANEIPYGYIDPNGEAMGAGPDVARAIAQELGIENIEWVTAGFSSLIPGLKADRFDMVAAEMAILPDRCNEILFSEPNTSYGEGLLVPAGNPQGITSYADFAENSDLTVAIMAGADQLEMMQQLGVDDSRMVMLSANADAISVVATGRADAYAATSLTASGLAGASDGVELAQGFVDPVIGGEEVRSWGGFAFSQESEDLRDAVNEALAEFKGTAEWEEILTSYGFADSDLAGSANSTTAELCGA